MTADSPLRTLPPERDEDLRRSRRLEWWTIGWMLSVIAVMGLTMQSSQAMKTAWLEDMLSLVPPIVFLIASHFEARPADRWFPFGYQRVNSLAFMIAAVTLATMGCFLLFEAARTLVMQERVTIGLVAPLGYEIWAGWPMIAALLYSVVPPVVLGRMKLPLARRLQDKVLHTDAQMNKADWMTGLAGIAGIVGLGFGLWWADAVAAGIISFSILRDGVRAMRIATAELVDGAPRALDADRISDDAQALQRTLAARYPGAPVKMRETGRFIRVVVEGADPPNDARPDAHWPDGVDRPWRLSELSFRPRTR
jgi:cation diffusion facilitator family transporter